MMMTVTTGVTTIITAAAAIIASTDTYVDFLCVRWCSKHFKNINYYSSTQPYELSTFIILTLWKKVKLLAWGHVVGKW